MLPVVFLQVQQSFSRQRSLLTGCFLTPGPVFRPASHNLRAHSLNQVYFNILVRIFVKNIFVNGGIIMKILCCKNLELYDTLKQDGPMCVGANNQHCT